MHRFKCKRRCSDYRDLLREAYSIDCVNDPEVHPAQFCPPCFQRADRISDTKSKGAMYESSVTPFVGQAILKTAVTCVKCSVSSQWVEGPERRGRTVVTQGTTAHTQSGNISIPASFQAVQPLYPSRFHIAASNISLADFQCPSWGMYIRCEGPACQQYVQLNNLADHLASGCRQHLHLPPDTTVGQLLS